MNLQRLPPLVARVAALLGGSAGSLPPSASAAEDAALVELLVRWRLAAEVAACLPVAHGLSRSATRSLALERERVRAAARTRDISLRIVGEALADAGIRGMLLKGEAVVRRTHGDPSRRPMADIDLLVASEAMPDAINALVARGLGTTRHDTPLHVVLRDGAPAQEHGTVVEVHCDVLEPPHPFALGLEAMMVRAEPAGDTGLFIPRAADALVLSCVHLAFHENDGRKTLLTLRDVALLSRCATIGASSETVTVDASLAGIVEHVAERAIAWAGADPLMLTHAAREPQAWSRRHALRAALREMDRTVVEARGERWRVLGRRLGHALWWPTAGERFRALGSLVLRLNPSALARAVAAFRSPTGR